MKNQLGFTLLEVMIAFALLSVILASVFITQTSSLAGSSRNKNILIATNLARNFINEQEVKYEGIPFDRLPSSEETGKFEEPYQNFSWKIKFEEVDFSALSDLMAKQAEQEGAATQENSGALVNVFEQYLKKSVRKMTVEIEWPEGGGTSRQSFTQLLVDYNAEFTASF